MKKHFKLGLILLAVSGTMVSCSKDDDDTSTGGTNNATSGVYTDSRDGKEYNWTTIGTQKWMTKNFSYDVSGSRVYADLASNEAKYGRLYTWDQALAAAPTGWRVATDNDWKQLEMHYGMTQTEADKLVQRGTDEGKKIGTGLKLEYAGWWHPSPGFSDIDQIAYYWTSTVSPTNNTKGVRRSYANFDDHSFRDYEAKSTMFSIRLIKE